MTHQRNIFYMWSIWNTFAIWFWSTIISFWISSFLSVSPLLLYFSPSRFLSFSSSLALFASELRMSHRSIFISIRNCIIDQMVFYRVCLTTSAWTWTEMIIFICCFVCIYWFLNSFCEPNSYWNMMSMVYAQMSRCSLFCYAIALVG